MSNNSKAPSFLIILSFVGFVALLLGGGAFLLTADSLKSDGEEQISQYTDNPVNFSVDDLDDSDVPTEDNNIDLDENSEDELNPERLVDSVMTGETDSMLGEDDLLAEGNEDSFTIGNRANSDETIEESNDIPVASNERNPEPESNVEPEPTPQPSREPQYRNVTTTLYWVQVGSFTTSIQAEEINRKLDSSGIAGIILSKEVNGTIWYRVRVGSFQNRDEAQLYQTQLENLAFISDTVIYESQVVEKIEI